MKILMPLLSYLARLSVGRAILWCYVIWYLCVLYFYFVPSISLWLNSLGLSLIVGSALVLATGPFNMHRIRTQFWVVSRLIMCPFFVSSFSALTTKSNFLLLLSPNLKENLVAVMACVIFLSSTFICKQTHRALTSTPQVK
jgi:hypothetical protein